MIIVVAKRPFLRKEKHGIDRDNSTPSERGTVTNRSRLRELFGIERKITLIICRSKAKQAYEILTILSSPRTIAKTVIRF